MDRRVRRKKTLKNSNHMVMEYLTITGHFKTR